MINLHEVTAFMKSTKAKPLTRKQLAMVVRLCDHREQYGWKMGREQLEAELKAKQKDGILDNSAVLMTIQRLGDANAQIATQLAAALAKNLQSR